MREADLERYLVACVTEMGGITAKMTVEGRRGWPDRLVILPPGRVLFVEVKKPKTGVASPGQKMMHRTLEKLGARVFQLNSIEQIDQVLKRYLPLIGNVYRDSP